MPYVYTKFTFNHFPQFGNPAQVLKITLKFLLSETALSKGHYHKTNMVSQGNGHKEGRLHYTLRL